MTSFNWWLKNVPELFNIYLVGVVTDPTGGVVAGAAVSIVSLETGVQQQTRTNEEGHFSVPFLLPGRYAVTVEHEGFATVKIDNILLQVNETRTLNIQLQAGEIKEEITVIAGQGDRLDRTSAALKFNVSGRQIRELPIISTAFGRTVIDQLPLLLPGIAPANTGLSSTTFSFSERIQRGLSMNGARTQAVNFSFEGGDNNDLEEGRVSALSPNPDAIAEFTVVTNTFDADSGRSSGGLINVAVKSGTNKRHGNVRYFGRRTGWNANDFTANASGSSLPLSNINVYGAQLGGPIWLPWLYNGQNKTFFFADYEGAGRRRGWTWMVPTITAKERRGDLSDGPDAMPDTGDDNPVINDPLGGTFPNSQIPPDRIHPIARHYLLFFPLPDGPGRLAHPTGDDRTQADQGTVRIDHRLGSKGSLSSTYFFGQETEDLFQPQLPVGVNRMQFRTQNLILTHTHSFTTQLVNQLAVGYVRLRNDAFEFNGATKITPAEAGFQFPPMDRRFAGLPRLLLLGPEGLPPFEGVSGSGRTSATYQIKDDVSWVRGSHSLKFGFDGRAFLGDNSKEINSLSFTFTALSNFLLGRPSNFNLRGSVPFELRESYWAGYVQDTWRTRPEWTVSVGVRYEYFSPFADAQGRVMGYRVGARSERFPEAPPNVIYAGDLDPVAGHRLPKSGYYADKNNVAPRVAVAYSPRVERGWLRPIFGPQRTVLRLGYGVFYDIGFGTPGQPSILCQEPFCQGVSLQSGALNQLPDPFARPIPADFQFTFGFSGRPFGLQAFDPRFRSAYTHEWTLSWQRELPANFFLEMAYVGRNGIKLLRATNLNQPQVRGRSLVRPDPRFNDITNFESTGTATYHALQAHVTRRWAAGLQAEVSYTWGKALDNIANLTQGDLLVSIPNVKARSSFDRRHMLVTNFIYELPSPSAGVQRTILGGWQLAGIFTIRSGAPLNIRQQNSTSGLMETLPDIVGPFQRFDPREIRTFRLPNGQVRTGNFFFDPTVFRVARDANGSPRPGTLGRNVFSGPGVNNWDLAVLKRTRLTEQIQLELRLDTNNVFNHPQFNSVAQQLGNIFFGQASSNDTARKVQVGVKLHF
jgi:hypothetical protein